MFNGQRLLFCLKVMGLLLVGQQSFAEVTKLWQLDGLSQPESVLWNPQANVLYVSNISGKPMEDNGKGYISMVSLEGKVIKKQWVTGLSSPKGMAIYKDFLYVADLKNLHIINHKTGQLLNSIKVHESTMLNDIAVDKQGVVYVSDLIGGGIYRLKNNQLSQWVNSKEFEHTNGLYFDDNQLIVATWGKGMNKDFSTNVLGGLYRVDIKTGKVSSIKSAHSIGNLDGIVQIDGRIIVNDWVSGTVFAYDKKKPNSTVKKLFNAGYSAADIGSYKNILYVPVMFSNRIDAYKLN